MINVTAKSPAITKKHDSIPVNPRLAYSLDEIAQATGLSVNFLRYEVRRGNLAIRKFGRRILVRDEDLRRYIDSGSFGKATATAKVSEVL
jgi:excisionase family DNA binding protein